MNAADRFRRAMAQEEAEGCPVAGLHFSVRTACNCGCGIPAGLSIRLGTGPTLTIIDPIQVDAVIDTLAAGRLAAWGPRPGPGKGGE